MVKFRYKRQSTQKKWLIFLRRQHDRTQGDFSASPARQGTRWCSGLLATIFLKHRSTRIHTDGASHFDDGKTADLRTAEQAFYHNSLLCRGLDICYTSKKWGTSGLEIPHDIRTLWVFQMHISISLSPCNQEQSDSQTSKFPR